MSTDGQVAAVGDLPVADSAVPRRRDAIRTAEGTLVKLMDAIVPLEGSKVPITATIATIFGVVLLTVSFVLAALPNFIGLSTTEFFAGVVCGLALALVGPTFELLGQRQRIKDLESVSAALNNLKRRSGEAAARAQQ